MAGTRDVAGPALHRHAYVRELDGIRGLSVLAVIGVHAAVPGFGGGFLGVDVFFVMSGFLITSLLIHESQERGSISLKHFYIRRALRLLPALFVFLAVCLAYYLLFPRANEARATFEAVPLTLGYVANLARAFGLHELGLLEHAWSLAIEEQFYLLAAPVVASLLTRRVRLRSIAIWLIVVAVGVGIHRARLWAFTGDFERVYLGTDTHGDGLLIGVAAACLYRAGVVPKTTGQRKALQAASVASAGVLLLLVGLLRVDDGAFLFFGGLTVVALLAAVVVYQVVTAPLGLTTAVLGVNWVVFVGKMSYGVYLWHLFVLRAFDHTTLLDQPIAAILRIGLALAIASASFLLIEQRFLRLKKRFDGSPAVPIDHSQASALPEPDVGDARSPFAPADPRSVDDGHRDGKLGLVTSLESDAAVAAAARVVDAKSAIDDDRRQRHKQPVWPGAFIDFAFPFADSSVRGWPTSEVAFVLSELVVGATWSPYWAEPPTGTAGHELCDRLDELARTRAESNWAILYRVGALPLWHAVEGKNRVALYRALGRPLLAEVRVSYHPPSSELVVRRGEQVSGVARANTPEGMLLLPVAAGADLLIATGAQPGPPLSGAEIVRLASQRERRERLLEYGG